MIQPVHESPRRLARPRARATVTSSAAVMLTLAMGCVVTPAASAASGLDGGARVQAQVRTVPGRTPVSDGTELARRAVRAAPLAASATSLEGTLTRIWIDPANGDAAPEHPATWIVGDAARVEVPAEDVAGIPTGAWVQASLASPSTPGTGRTAPRRALGVRVEEPSSAAGEAAAATSDGSQAMAATTTTTTTTTSAHSVTLVLVRPAGAAPDTMTVATMKTRVSEASTFWRTQSRGRLSFSVAKAYANSSTKDWLTTRAACSDYYGLWNEAATKVGFTAGARKHLVVYVPTGAAGCSAGLGTIGSGIDSGGYLYVNGNLTSLVAHELGHNLSLGHSNGLQCDGVSDGTKSTTWSNGCSVKTYRDWYDVMGISWSSLGTLSTFHGRRLGVVPAAQVVSVTKPLLLTLSPVWSTSGIISAQVTDPAGVVYTVEYRPASGADSWLASNYRGIRPGVIVRRPLPGDASQTLLLDGSPSATASWGSDWDQPVGSSSLVSASGRLRLTTMATTDASATVMVSIDGVSPALPVSANPTPSTSRTGTSQVSLVEPSSVAVREGTSVVTTRAAVKVRSVAVRRVVTAKR